MVKKPKKSKLLTPQHRLTRERLSENLLGLIEAQFPVSKYGTRSAREKAVAKGVGCSWSTIQRILNQEVGPSTDMLVDLGNAFSVSPSDLLTPNFVETYLARREEQRRAG